MPPDFARYAASEGNLRLRKRFNVGGVTIEMWRRQLGLRYQPPPPKHVPRVTIRRRVKRFTAYDHERIEDLDDFGTGDLARSLDLRSFERDW